MYLADKLVDLDIAGLVQSPAKVYFLELDRLWWEEVREDVLRNQLVVRIILRSTASCGLSNN